MIRFSRLSLSFSLLIFFPIFSAQKDILVLSTNNTQEWISAHIEAITPEQKQIAANILYLLYANALIEEQAQQFFTPLTRLVQEIKSEVRAYKNPAEQLATLKKLTERLSFIASARTIYNQSLTQCVNFYNQNTQYTSTISPAFNALQDNGQVLLINWANENSENIGKHITACSAMFTESSQYFQISAGLMKGIGEGQLPLESEDNTRSLVSLDAFLKNSLQATTSTENILNALAHQTDQTIALIAVANKIYKHYYQAIYNHLQSESIDKKYRKTMFGMYGLVPEEYRSELPTAENALEHILQTIKLYTQTELSK